MGKVSKESLQITKVKRKGSDLYGSIYGHTRQGLCRSGDSQDHGMVQLDSSRKLAS